MIRRAPIKLDGKYLVSLKRMMVFRVIAAFILLGSTFFVHLKDLQALPGSPLKYFYGLAIFIFLCSLVYFATIKLAKNFVRFAFIQICIDTIIVTILVYLSGGFASFYSFLLPVVSIYASVFLSLMGTLVVTILASIQYICLIGLEYNQITPPVFPNWAHSAANYPFFYVLYKTTLVVTACFSVSLLTSYLIAQAKKVRLELKAMRAHLQRVEKMASLGEMAAGLAHEIKNPLASMTGSIQLLNQDMSGDPDQDKLMKIIKREATRLSNLVNNFLLFAKMPNGQLKTVNLGSEIEETLELLSKDGGHSGVVINKYLRSDLWVEIDPVHLRQILWNLLLNAIEAVEKNGQISIRTKVMANHITFEISDNGVGISPEDKERIFLPFFSSKPRGTGLGLSIVHNLLEGYDSRLDIESTKGEGTTATFRLKRLEPISKKI